MRNFLWNSDFCRRFEYCRFVQYSTLCTGTRRGRFTAGNTEKCNRRNVPYVSVLITGAVAILLTLTRSFAELAAISVISRFSQYIPTCIAVPVLRRKNPEHSGYKVPLGMMFPAIAVLASVWLLYHTEVYRLVAGLGAMLLVAPLYLIMKKK